MTMQNIINVFWNKRAEYYDAPNYLLLERRTLLEYDFNYTASKRWFLYGKGSISITDFCHELYDQVNNKWWEVDWRVDEEALLREVTPYIDVILSHWLIKDGEHFFTPAAYRALKKISAIVERHSQAAERLGILQRPCYYIRDAFYSLKYRYC